MIDTGIAFRYARALFELAQERNLSAEAAEDMATLKRILDEVPQARRFCLRERDNRIAEMEFVEIALLPHVSDLTGETLKTAIRNGRIGILPFLPGAYRSVQDLYEDTRRVLLETAVAAEPGLARRVEEAMERRLGKHVELELRTAPEIIGGLRISWNSRLIDLSAATRLKQMRSWIKSA